MSFAWSDFLDLSIALVRAPDTPGPKEAALRTAISRAYYAAFGTARAIAIVRDGFVIRKTGEDHERVISHFAFTKDRTRSRIGADLLRLKHRRTRADYDISLPVEAISWAQSSVDIARNVLNDLNSLDPETSHE